MSRSGTQCTVTFDFDALHFYASPLPERPELHTACIKFICYSALEIVPTEVSINRNVIDTTHSPFYVVLSNTSNSDLYVWREWCSWGYFSLSFTVSMPDGKSFEVKKKAGVWTRNYPDPYLVRPDRHFVWNVRFSPDEWQAFPSDWKDGEVTIQAHFEQTKDESLPPTVKEPPNMWFGRVSSDSWKVALYKEKR